MSPVNLWYLIDNINVSMVISRIIALVYDRVKPCCFSSQVNINLDDFQLSKTVFIPVSYTHLTLPTKRIV